MAYSSKVDVNCPGLCLTHLVTFHSSPKLMPYALLGSPYLKYTNESKNRALYETATFIGFLHLSCAMDAFGSLMKPIATFSE